MLRIIEDFFNFVIVKFQSFFPFFSFTSDFHKGPFFAWEPTLSEDSAKTSPLPAISSDPS